MSTEALGWYASIFAWLFFTGIGIPPVPEEAGILYAAELNALQPEVRWPIAWTMTGLCIVCADMVLYGVGRRRGVKLFDYRWLGHDGALFASARLLLSGGGSLSR